MSCCPEASKPEMMGKFEKYKVEDAFRDIERSEVHKQDSDLMEQVQILAKKKVKAISSIADLKNRRKELSEDDDS